TRRSPDLGGPLEPHGIARAIHRDLLLALLDEFDSGISSFSSILGSASPRISCAFPDSSRSLRWMRFSFSIAASFLSRCAMVRSEEHTSELQSRENLVCRLLL